MKKHSDRERIRVKAPGTPARMILPEVGKVTDFSGALSQTLEGAAGSLEPTEIAIG
jgi:hypothetical protein